MKDQIPNPILNEQELEEEKKLEKRYHELTEPNGIIKVGKKAAELVPDKAKQIARNAWDGITEQEFVAQALKYAAEGFGILEENAARLTVSEETVIKRINDKMDDMTIDSLKEVCFARAYDIRKIVNNYKNSNTLAAAIEGGSTGALGFLGLIPNLVISTFLYFRAVESVGIFYGYDVKNDPVEMEIASGVMMSAMSPSNDASNNELTATIGKFLVFTETTAVKQTAKKTWAAMAEAGGLSLLIAQIRALANAYARKALERVGAKSLENSAFKKILEQLGKHLSLKAAGHAMPVIGGVFGALFDTAQMKKMVDYADIFYCKRFIAEKEVRINTISNA